MLQLDSLDETKVGKQKYMIWEHKMRYLSSTIEDFVNSRKNFIFVNHNYTSHWNFLLAVYFPSSKQICVYLFESLNEESRNSLNKNETESKDIRMITLV